MQTGRGAAAKPPIGIAFEGDLGNRVDAVLAVAMLNGLASKGEARRIALCVSRPSLKAAQLADIVAAYYAGRAIAGPGSGGVGGNPDGMIGMPETGPKDDAPPLAATVLKASPEGTPLYTSVIGRVLDTADNAVLIRNMLLAQNDGNATVVVAGPLTGVARLLTLYGARPQIATKARELVLAVGAFPARPDAALAADVPAARKILADWPTPVVFAGAEVGEALRFPGATIDRDMAAVRAHPVADTYRAAGTMPFDAPASALAAVLYAAHPTDGLFKLSEPGTVTVSDDGRTSFTAGPEGRHRYLIVDPAQREKVLGLYSALVAAPPAPRPGRRGGPPPAAAQQQAPAQPAQPQQAVPPQAPAQVPPAQR